MKKQEPCFFREKPKCGKEIVDMGKGVVELPDGGCATESEALNALVREAKRRNTSYGLLVASTTERQRKEIIRGYCAAKRREARRGRK